MDNLEINTAIQISRTPHEVFEAIADPEKMSKYFISSGSGRMEENKTLTWKFPEFDEEFKVKTGRVENDKLIIFYWTIEGKELTVEILLEERENGSTLVHIIEKGMENNPAGIRWLAGNTQGWANFLACLKAYLEYGINLRKGAFDFLRTK